MAFVWLSSVLVGFVWLSLIGSVCSRFANSNWLTRVVQSNKCSTTQVMKLNRIGLSSITESSICSPIIELTGKKWVLFDYGLRKRLIPFFFSRFSGERKRARSERGAPPDTTHARRENAPSPVARVWSSSLASSLPSLAGKRDLIGLNLWIMIPIKFRNECDN